MTPEEIAAAARIVTAWYGDEALSPDVFSERKHWHDQLTDVLQTARAELAKLDSATVAERGNDNCLISAAGESPAQSARISELESAKRWQEAVERWFIVWHQVPDETDPYQQICKMLAWEQKVALDPAVSAGAAKLVKDARIVMLREIREPTESMLNAARDWSVHKFGIGVGYDDARECFQAMLDAAIEAVVKWLEGQ